jgi:hypothetical protein
MAEIGKPERRRILVPDNLPALPPEKELPPKPPVQVPEKEPA